jgi:hypothetical protein
MSELADQTVDRFWIKDTTANHVDYILADTNWTAGIVETLGTVTLKVDKRQSVLETLYQLVNLVGGELYFNSDRTVDLKREIGSITSLPLRIDKNVNVLEYEEDSTGLITRIYPYGPDNLSTDTVVIEAMDDASAWTCSGTSSAVDVTVIKVQGSGSINFIAADGETMTQDLGAGGTLDLTGLDTLELWLYDNTGSGLDFDTYPCYFGIGESAWTDNKLTITGTVNADSWKKIELDISGIADASKNAIRYIGFESGGEDLYIDDVRAVGTVYIDSDHVSEYKVKKEYVYNHSASLEVAQKTVKVYPSDDAPTDEQYPNTNNRWLTLGVSNEAGDAQIPCIKFPIDDIPANATIVSAILYMCVSAIDSRGAVDTVSIYYNDADFDESTLTYNNRPSPDGAAITTISGAAVGWQSADLTTAFTNWVTGVKSNYGLQLQNAAAASDHRTNYYPKETYNYRPYFLVTYTFTTNNTDIVRDAAQLKLADSDEPAYRYKVKMVDLSRVIADTWAGETIGLGDAVRLYDADFGINTVMRVKRITEDRLNPANTEVELVNRTYDITDQEAANAKKLKSVMPFEDKNIVDANAIQKGAIGGEVE